MDAPRPTEGLVHAHASATASPPVATGLPPAPGQRDAEEHDLIPRSFGIEEFEQMMLDGTIRDGCTLSAWGLYLMWKARR